MSKRKPPYHHADGSGCWTVDCSLRQTTHETQLPYEKFYNNPPTLKTTTSPVEAAQKLQKEYSVSISFTETSTPGYVNLNHIAVPKSKRNQGIGSAVMSKLMEEADRNNWTVALTPSDLFGSNERRLEVFYRGFGFVTSRDKLTHESMIRYPQ